jgi:hypothetical protein
MSVSSMGISFPIREAIDDRSECKSSLAKMSRIEALIGGDTGMTRYSKSARPVNDHCLEHTRDLVFASLRS